MREHSRSRAEKPASERVGVAQTLTSWEESPGVTVAWCGKAKASTKRPYVQIWPASTILVVARHRLAQSEQK
jgi:hypothetical protein